MSTSELIPTLNTPPTFNTPPSFNTPFIYPQTTGEFTNVLLIDDSVQDSQIIFDSVNSNTFPVIYSRNSKKTELMELLDSKCKSIDRIGILFNSLGETSPLFLDLKPLMLPDEAAAPYSENVEFMIELLKKFQVKNIDYLACNTLLYDSWKTYYAILKDQTGVIVGASNDRTGNVKYGGDWIMESTNEDIELVYFTRNIEYYQYLFDIYTDSQGLNYLYTIGTSIATVTSGNYSNVNYNISSSISVGGTNYSVTSIGNSAFQSCTVLTSITIPNSVTSIGNSAFQSCTVLTSITIPNSVTSIGDYAFYNCRGLTSITIPSSVTSIGNSAFQGCTGLTSITIPSSVTSIGYYAFYDCRGLTSITIPNSVTTIGNAAFAGCTGLTSITIPSSVTYIGDNAFQGCTGLTSITIPSSVTSIGNSAFQGCTVLTSITIPSSVTSIGSYAFAYCSVLTSITIPNSVTSIGNSAFQSCSGLTSITIPSSVTSIGNSVFESCTGLTSITIPSSVTSIGNGAFYGCSGLTSITIPSSVTSIRDYAFTGCTVLTSITIPSSVTSIGTNAFQSCTGLTSITIPSGVTSIGTNAFQGCTGLTSITIPSSVTSIGTGTFQGCTVLTYITIPSSVTSIGTNAFRGCTGLTSITIPSSVTSIGQYAFESCTGLTSITIPSSVTSIGQYAFYNCSMLSTVIFCGLTIPSIGNASFNNIAISSTAYYVNGATNLNTINGIFTNKIPIPSPTITTISPYTGFTRGNTSVIITGTNFRYNPVVLFDSSAATITSFSNTQIICSTPSHSAGTVTVTVTTPAGSAITNFTYIIPPPAITAISPSIGRSSGNTSVTITGTDFSYNPIVLFDFSAATITSFSNTQIICKSPPHSQGSVTVTVTTYGGSATTSFTYIIPSCFKEDSKILTDKGYIPVQELRKGDLVKTLLHGFVPIVMIGKREIEHIVSNDRIKDQLYKCSSTEYPEVFEDLVITGCHSILVDHFSSNEEMQHALFINAGRVCVTDNKLRLPACADERASVYEIPGKYMIYHIALENEDYYMNYGVYANGLLVETCSKRFLKELSGMELIE